jgi:hypothetical protein
VADRGADSDTAVRIRVSHTCLEERL